MTAAVKSTRWLPMGGLALVLTTILVWLYARAPQHDTAGYLSNVAMLRQFKQIDAQWELNVLKARNGLATDYDALVDPLLNLTRLQQQLRMHAGVKSHVEAYALAATEDALEQAVQQKAQLIERFKSHNSILRNSLAFLPTAAGDIRHTLDQVSVASPQLVPDLSARVNDLLVNSLVYSRAVSADLASEVEADLALLATRQARLPASLNEQIGLFAAHVRTVLREQPIVDQLLADISDLTLTVPGHMEPVLARRGCVSC